MSSLERADVRGDTEFDRAVRTRPVAGDPTAYEAALDPGWQIGAGINGGMLLATAGHALRHAFGDHGHPDPLTISAYYLSASKPGPATLRTATLRQGRTLSTGQVSLVQHDGADGAADGAGTERLRALASYGDLAALPDDVRTSLTPPEMPPPEECVGSDLAPESFKRQATFLDRLDLRLDPACAGWAMGEPSGRGLLQGWLRLADGREPDPLMLLLAVDALPPVTFDLGRFGWAPTLELTAHLRAAPAPGWLAVKHQTRNMAGGLFEEDAEVWDSTGRLVAQSRQLAMLPRSAE